ncbi:membrane protein [Iodidimonas gelatinilytica]|uniref:Membrane protein n=2 Tax=Iodidimonas gelatinilytica TaxID=1236966 RepID=A0A5A7MS03_9PROT|nr:HlyC/CorC family transporter [Iodidimonas gelatinilytica]GEQ97748.1 membrane protein [Iodidimonas gelatinilytica]
MLIAHISSLAFIFVLLCLSAFFSGSETALTAASRARIHRLARDGDGRAKRVEKLIEDKERLIGAILLGNNLVNILASALATSVFIALVGESGVVYATLIMTALVLIFSEVLPKSYAISNPDGMALAVGRVIGLVVLLFSPVVNLVRHIVRGTLNMFGVDLESNEAVLSARDEIRGVIDLGASEGGIRKSHRDMLDSILDLDDITVEDVMIHRKNMALIDLAMPAQEIVDEVIESPFTRLPIYEDDAENIVGVLHAKDVLRAMKATSDPAEIDIRAIMTDAWFVPETTTLREQMNAFLSRRAHFAMVVDEYGAIQGLITLEDILEEIVGDITDEFDHANHGVKKLADGWIQVDGTMTIRDLNRRFDWSLPDSDASTLAGLVIYESEIIPIVGQRFQFHGFDFEIIGRRRNQLTQIKVRPVAADAVSGD